MDWELQNELAEMARDTRVHALRAEALKRKVAGAMADDAQSGSRFSIVRAISAMSRNGVSGGPEQEISQRNTSLELGRVHDPFRLQLHPRDLGWHQRTLMQVGTAANGGYMVGASVTGFDALMDVSALARAGATIWPTIATGTQGLPGFATNTAAAWGTEVGTATASDPTVTARAATPKRVTALTSISRQLLVQSPTAEAMLNRHLLMAVGKALDVAGLSGTSGSTNPVGIPYLSGLGTSILGTSFTGANGFSLVQKCAESATDDSRIRAIAAPSVRALLSGRNVGTNVNVPIWQDGMVSGVSGMASANALANSIIYGDWTHVQILTWGLELSMNPYSANFMSDLVDVKCVLYADVQVNYPAAFAVGTGCT